MSSVYGVRPLSTQITCVLMRRWISELWLQTFMNTTLFLRLRIQVCGKFVEKCWNDITGSGHGENKSNLYSFFLIQFYHFNRTLQWITFENDCLKANNIYLPANANADRVDQYLPYLMTAFTEIIKTFCRERRLCLAKRKRLKQPRRRERSGVSVLMWQEDESRATETE